jgi:hypothetical protein
MFARFLFKMGTSMVHQGGIEGFMSFEKKLIGLNARCGHHITMVSGQLWWKTLGRRYSESDHGQRPLKRPSPYCNTELGDGARLITQVLRSDWHGLTCKLHLIEGNAPQVIKCRLSLHETRGICLTI